MVRPVIRKVDSNHAEIIATFRRLGWSVVSTAIVSHGFPDAAVGKWGYTHLVEIKDGKKPPSARRLTEDEIRFHAEWRGSVHIIESVEDVIEFDRKRTRRHSDG